MQGSCIAFFSEGFGWDTMVYVDIEPTLPSRRVSRPKYSTFFDGGSVRSVYSLQTDDFLHHLASLGMQAGTALLAFYDSQHLLHHRQYAST